MVPLIVGRGISDRTGEIINLDMLRLAYPTRWKYNILRALEYFRKAKASYDERMQEALDVVYKKRTSDGSWNTLRAFRVLDYFK